MRCLSVFVFLFFFLFGMKSGHLVFWGFKVTLEEERTQEKAVGETFCGWM